MNMKSFPDIEAYKGQFFKETIIPDGAYLNTHYPRFKMTWDFAWRKTDKIGTLLDVGAHWLHQGVLYASQGVEVTAADLPSTFKVPEVQAIAKQHDIKLVTYTDLSQPAVLDELPESHYELVLFAEIIEHITFNPVDMWKAIYRVLQPGGRILVTTPNYYHLKGRAWDVKRFFSRSGGGITPKEILNIPTYGPHWKEFSAKELLQYFTLLSPDFEVTEIQHSTIPYSQPTKLREKLQRKVEDWFPLLRNNLFAEVTLVRKEVGIVPNPSWT